MGRERGQGLLRYHAAEQHHSAARQANGLPLPFAATIFGPSGKEIGVVGQGSMMFISDASAPKATVKWSGGQCSVELSQEKTKETLCR